MRKNDNRRAHVTLSHLLSLGEKIMATLSEFIQAQTDYNAKIDASLADLAGDVSNLTATIEKLKASAGQLSAEDQASLDALTEHAKTVTDKLDALNQLTPPEVPSSDAAPVEAEPAKS